MSRFEDFTEFELLTMMDCIHDVVDESNRKTFRHLPELIQNVFLALYAEGTAELNNRPTSR